MVTPTNPGKEVGAVERIKEIEKYAKLLVVRDEHEYNQDAADLKFLLKAFRVMRELALDAYPKREHVRADGASVDAMFEAAMREPEK